MFNFSSRVDSQRYLFRVEIVKTSVFNIEKMTSNISASFFRSLMV